MNNVIYINNIPVSIKNSSGTVLQHCELNQISIPRFCYHRQLSIAGNCRVCMVEIKNSVKPVISCATNISNNMYIYTNSDLVKIARENVLEFLLINHPLDCPICDQAGECDLQDQTMVFGSDRGRFYQKKRAVSDKNFTPVISSIMTRCIHCTRCVRFSEEVAGMFFFGTMGRGTDTEISAYQNQTKFINEISGNVVDICPVGALTSKPYAFTARSWELYSIYSIDILDSLCSNIIINVKNNAIMRILPKRNDSLNTEWISDKIRFSYQNIMLNRLFYPVLNKQNMSIISSWKNIYKQCVKRLLLGTIEKKIEIQLNVLHDLQTLYNIKKVSSVTNASIFLENFPNNINYNVNLRNNWLFNNNISDILNSEVLIVDQIDLRLENTIFNALLYNSCYINNRYFFKIGSALTTHAYVIQIGISNYTSSLINRGKHFFCKRMKNKAKVNYITNNNSNNFTNKKKHYVCSKNINVLFPGIINNLEVATENINNNYKINKNTYVINCNTDNFITNNKPFIQMQTNQNTTSKYYINIPIVTMFEDVGSYINIFGKKQTTNTAMNITNNIISVNQFFNNVYTLLNYYSKFNTKINNITTILNNISNTKQIYIGNIYFTNYILNKNYKLNNIKTYYTSQINNNVTDTLLALYKLQKKTITYNT